MNKLAHKIEVCFRKYFEDDNKKELLKNKQFELISEELCETFFKTISPKLISFKPQFKHEFIKVLKNYEVS